MSTLVETSSNQPVLFITIYCTQKRMSTWCHLKMFPCCLFDCLKLKHVFLVFLGCFCTGKYVRSASSNQVFVKAKTSLRFLVSARVASDPRVGMFSLLILFCSETMSNCRHNCWIERNFALLYFKRIFHIRVNLCPICEASLSHHTLCMFPITEYMFHWLAKKKKITPKRKPQKV